MAKSEAKFQAGTPVVLEEGDLDRVSIWLPQNLCSEFDERHRGPVRCDTVTDPCDRRELRKTLQH